MAVKQYGASAKRAAQKKGQPRKISAPLIVGLVGLGLVAAGIIWLVVSAAGSSAAAGSGAAAVAAPVSGKALANFTLTDLAGQKVSLSDYAGRPVLINAWATWCPPCQAEMPDLHDLYLKHQDEGFAVLAVDAGEDSAIVRNFIQQQGFTFPVLLDPQMTLLDRLAIRNYPTSILVGRDGKVKLVQVGILSKDAIKNVVEPLISE